MKMYLNADDEIRRCHVEQRMSTSMGRARAHARMRLKRKRGDEGEFSFAASETWSG